MSKELNEEEAFVLECRRNEIIEQIEGRMLTNKYDGIHSKPFGVRSRQVAVLIDILVERGIL